MSGGATSSRLLNLEASDGISGLGTDRGDSETMARPKGGLVGGHRYPEVGSDMEVSL
jgi:hypothetical protein